MKELDQIETTLVSGGDGETYNWGKMIGDGLKSAWESMKDYAASDDSSRDVIV